MCCVAIGVMLRKFSFSIAMPWKMTVNTKLIGVAAIDRFRILSVASILTTNGINVPKENMTACCIYRRLLLLKAKCRMMQIAAIMHR